MNFLEPISLALNSIRENKLRAFLTLVGVAIGVFAILGFKIISYSFTIMMTEQMDELGENSFRVNRMPNLSMSGPGSWRKYRDRPIIKLKHLKKLRERIQYTDLISGTMEREGVTIKSPNYTSDPNVQLIGADDKYFQISKLNIFKGRPFTHDDIRFKLKVALIGFDVWKRIFPFSDPIGQKIRISGHTYQVVGILEEKGVMLGNSLDNKVMIPLINYLDHHKAAWYNSLELLFSSYDRESYEETVDETRGVLRSIYGLKPWDEDKFELVGNESVKEQFSSMEFFFSMFAIVVGGLSLLVAGIGILNIMLITIKERTKEIGIRKAVGAKSRWILIQFLIETMTITFTGWLFGFLVTIGIFKSVETLKYLEYFEYFKNNLIISNLQNVNFYVPLDWVIYSLIACLFFGITFGMFPAYKAAKLDPIESLRYE